MKIFGYHIVKQKKIPIHALVSEIRTALGVPQTRENYNIIEYTYLRALKDLGINNQKGKRS